MQWSLHTRKVCLYGIFCALMCNRQWSVMIGERKRGYMRAPSITESTKEERLEYIRKQYACRSDCESCGLCAVLKGKAPELAFGEYIEGNVELTEIRLSR